jgi:hypothetical protein
MIAEYWKLAEESTNKPSRWLEINQIKKRGRDGTIPVCHRLSLTPSPLPREREGLEAEWGVVAIFETRTDGTARFGWRVLAHGSALLPWLCGSVAHSARDFKFEISDLGRAF